MTNPKIDTAYGIWDAEKERLVKRKATQPAIYDDISIARAKRTRLAGRRYPNRYKLVELNISIVNIYE